MDKKLLETFEPLINKIASKFYNVEKEDLIQAGKVGLINAYNHYDKNLNTKFSTYAYNYIFGEMYELSITSKNIKVNRDTLKLVKLIEKTKNYLTQKLNKIPTLKEISTYLEIDENTIYNAYITTNSILSLDQESEDINLYDLISTSCDNDLRIDLINSINKLSKEEQDIIKYRYFNDLTQSEIAKKLNMSQVKVSRSVNKSLKTLKKIMSYE